MAAPKKSCIEKKITLNLLKEMRQPFLDLPDMSHQDRSQKLQSRWPQFSVRTLESYSRILVGATEKAWSLCVEGKIPLSAMEELVSWEAKTQDFMVEEYVTKKMTPEILRKIKRLRREHDMPYAEAIARALGEIPADQPRRGEQRKSLDSLLAEIADKGARWRAMVSMALEMVGDEEAKNGVHMAVFEKTYLLRQVIGEQYDFINNRLQRYMNAIRKRMAAGDQPTPAEAVPSQELENGGADGAVTSDTETKE